MKSIWAISCGEYSSYGVVAVFASEEAAQEAAEALNAAGGQRRERYEVETFPFYEDSDFTLIPCFYATGKTGGDMDISVSEDAPDLPHYAPVRPRVKVRSLHGGSQSVTATCRDRDAAIKAVKDRLAALKATDFSTP